MYQNSNFYNLVYLKFDPLVVEKKQKKFKTFTDTRADKRTNKRKIDGHQMNRLAHLNFLFS